MQVEIIQQGYVPGFVEDVESVMELINSCTPILLHKRGNAMKSQPKVTYGVANENGEMPLFRWGFDKQDWTAINPMPVEFMPIVIKIEKLFGVRTNHCLANHFTDGTKCVPVHRDQPFSPDGKNFEKNLEMNMAEHS